MMFKWLPDTAIDWRDVWLGAATTAILFELGKTAIGFYIGRQALESTYGAAASIIVVLIWVYYSSQIMLMGAEITHAFARHQGSRKTQSDFTAQRPMKNGMISTTPTGGPDRGASTEHDRVMERDHHSLPGT